MMNKPNLDGISKQLYDCFQQSDKAKQEEALAILEVAFRPQSTRGTAPTNPATFLARGEDL